MPRTVNPSASCQTEISFDREPGQKAITGARVLAERRGRGAKRALENPGGRS